MKQFTTKEQTDRLIELGYPKPNSIKSAKMGLFMGTKIPCIDKEFAYSIGELMGILFEWYYKRKKIYPEDPVIFYSVGFYPNEFAVLIFEDADEDVHDPELIDALYKALVKIKEDNLI